MADIPSPYPGPRPFELEDRLSFFGREQETQELITRLEQARVVILFGSAGSGKTSFVNAAFVHGLSAASRPWRVVTVRLGVENLRDQYPAARDPITREEADLLTLLRRREASQRQVVVIVDQFEELFALEHRIEERRRVIDSLLSSTEEGSARLILVIRTDFLGAALEDPYALGRLGHQDASTLLFPLPALTREVLREAALRMAERSGVLYEGGLIEEILDDLGPGPVNAAYLQLVLSALWSSSQRRHDQLLTRHDYHALGKADGVTQSLHEFDSWREQVRPLLLAWNGSGRPRELLLSGPLLGRGKRLEAGPVARLLPTEYRQYLRLSLEAEEATLLSSRALQQTLKVLQLPGLARRLAEAERGFAETTRELTDAEERYQRYLQRLKELREVMEKSAPKVFISYAHEDETVVSRVYDELRNQGLSPWIDKHDIPIGKEWEREIKRAMRTADFVVIFMSKRSVDKRGYVQREIRQALDLYQEIPAGQSFLMAVRLDDCEVPEDLTQYQWLDFTDKDAVKRLVTDITKEWASRQPSGST